MLVTGPTGSGKSTTLAAIIDKVNKTYDKHVVTIEDPVEFVHQNRNSHLLAPRGGPPHPGLRTEALRVGIRQDADVILVGEMREQETIALAITAAEMGMLVFGTLHTNNAAKTDRPHHRRLPGRGAEHDGLSLALRVALAGIVSQLLLPTADGKGRVRVQRDPAEDPGPTRTLSATATPRCSTPSSSPGKAQGMQAMDDVLFAYAKEGKITAQDAYMKATDKARFEPLVDGQPG